MNTGSPPISITRTSAAGRSWSGAVTPKLTPLILATGFVSGELLGEPSAQLRANMAGGEVLLITPCQSQSRYRSPAWARLLRAVAFCDPQRRRVQDAYLHTI